MNVVERIQPIIIVGAGGFAREVAQLIADVNAQRPTYSLLGYLDDNIAPGTSIGGQTVLGGLDSAQSHAGEVHFVVGVGSPMIKRRLATRLADAGLVLETLVHPSAQVGRDICLGKGSVICAGCILTCDITVGTLVTLNLACTVGHDAVISDFVSIAPGSNISGNVTVGQGCDVGTGAATVQGVTLGEWSVVGAGALVATDLPPNITAVGVPAKAIKHREPGWHL